jgi:hypothetical protein
MLFLSLHVTRCSPLREIPKKAFSTSCPEVEELYLIIYTPVSNPFIQEFKTLSLW